MKHETSYHVLKHVPDETRGASGRVKKGTGTAWLQISLYFVGWDGMGERLRGKKRKKQQQRKKKNNNGLTQVLSSPISHFFFLMVFFFLLACLFRQMPTEWKDLLYVFHSILSCTTATHCHIYHPSIFVFVFLFLGLSCHAFFFLCHKFMGNCCLARLHHNNHEVWLTTRTVQIIIIIIITAGLVLFICR